MDDKDDIEIDDDRVGGSSKSSKSKSSKSDIKIRRVKLNGGPHDGESTMVSHDVAVHSGEIYVRDGRRPNNKNEFIHAITLLRDLPVKQRIREHDTMQKWLECVANKHFEKDARSMVDDYRLVAWIELFRRGIFPSQRKILINADYVY